MERIDAEFLADALRRASRRLENQRAWLCALDGEIGDGDHGTSMANGFDAIGRALNAEPPARPADVLRVAANAFLAEVGATAGPLYASAFLEAASRLDTPKDLPLDRFGELLATLAAGIARCGKAQPGDKTMLDVWVPAAQAAQRAVREHADAMGIANITRDAAAAARDETVALMAMRGRAARLHERSIGHMDPGAASSAEIIFAFCDTIAERESKGQGG